MKPSLILMSHGNFASELYKSAQMIVGEIDDLYTISVLDEDGLAGAEGKLEKIFDIIGNKPVVMAVDMFAGTPSNVAVRTMSQNPNVRVVTGLNLPMAIEYAVSDIQQLDEMAEFLKQVGLEAVQIVELPELDDGEEGYED